ncbi:MAG: ABC transporter ATP-binding protein [Mariprofundaceae bacterium]|nr:ABC transporter ATP-binding protein [Mariprofundaceae bacterium]
MSLIDIQSLHFSVPTGHIIQKRKTILNDVSFSVKQGTSTAYLGTNGAGKTSTFRILCGLVRPNSGQVIFDGEVMRQGLPPKRFGFMPEHPYFYKNLTPHELLTGLGKLSGLSSQGLPQIIDNWAEKLDFTQVLHQRLSTCSKGQAQRVGLAQALIHQPDFILLDEPLSGLDPIGRACVRSVIQDEIKRGATLLFSSHILSDAEAMCDQVVVLQDGSIRYAGDIHSLLSPDAKWLIQAQGKPVWAQYSDLEITQTLDGTWQIRGANMQTRDALLQQLLSSEDTVLISVQTEQGTLESAFLHLLQSKEENDASHS